MQWEVNIDTNGEQAYSSAKELIDGVAVPFPNYALCLPGYSLLDGTFDNSPNKIRNTGNGYISTSLSNEAGFFINKPTITVTFERKKTSNGIQLAFNDVSGDYCNDLDIVWYLGDIEVARQNYKPNDIVYFCKSKVGQFNKFIITFNSTNNPYRYLFLSQIKNERLTKAGGLKIVYDDIALGAKENSNPISDDKKYYVDLNNLKENNIEFPSYAMCLPGYSLMDGSFDNAPPEISNVGYVSNSISDGNGEFESSPIITIEFKNKYSSVGISFTFNDYTEDYCSLLNIKWYNDDLLISDKDFIPDSYSYFCNNQVKLYNKLVITFKKTSKPFRNVFVTRIDYGLERVFTDTEIKDINCYMEISPISEVLSINTLNFTIRSETDIAFDFQKRQKLNLYFDEALLGIFYLKSGKRTSLVDYYHESQDIVGVLDGVEYMGGVYDNISVSALVADVMAGESIDYYIDDSLANKILSGYLPICKKREALAQIGFAIGAVIDTSFDTNLYIYPKQDVISGIVDGDSIYSGTVSIEHEDIVTGVQVNVHSYIQGTETEELFNGTLNGTARVTLDEPHYSFSITGGTIIESGANHVIISGTGNVVLTGTKYIHSTTTIEKHNEDIISDKKVITVESATLVNHSNANDVLNRVYGYYTKNESVKARILLKEFELGQVASIETGFDGIKTGTIESLNLKFTQEISAEVKIK